MFDYTAIIRIASTMLIILLYFLGLLCMRKPEFAWKFFRFIFVLTMTILAAMAFIVIWGDTISWSLPWIS